MPAKIEFVGRNVLMPNDGTWEEWIEYCKNIETKYSVHGKQA